MSSPFISEIRMFGGNFAPRSWALCNGQVLSIAQNTALFSLLGTTYGGNGTTNFALPNLQSRAPMGFGNGPGLTPRNLGETGGVTAVTLLPTEMPSHTHLVNASTLTSDQTSPVNDFGGQVLNGRNSTPRYNSTTDTTMGAVGNAGGSLPHDNMPPYQVVTFIICLQGVFPARN